jgi:hypothetical protein
LLNGLPSLSRSRTESSGSVTASLSRSRSRVIRTPWCLVSVTGRTTTERPVALWSRAGARVKARNSYSYERSAKYPLMFLPARFDLWVRAGGLDHHAASAGQLGDVLVDGGAADAEQPAPAARSPAAPGGWAPPRPAPPAAAARAAPAAPRRPGRPPPPPPPRGTPRPPPGTSRACRWARLPPR